MIWVLIFGGVALLGLVTVVSYAVWLAHKASDVFSEIRVLAGRMEEIAELLGQIEVPAPSDYNAHSDPEIVSGK